MYNIVRKIQFCSGHRVLGHENKCSNLHGHNFTLFVHAKSDKLDKVGRVIDFSQIKDIIKTWIDNNIDHTTIINKDDAELIRCLGAFKQEKPFYILKNNPTAENIAHHLLYDIFPGLMKETGIEIFKVVLHETDNCFVEVEKPENWCKRVFIRG